MILEQNVLKLKNKFQPPQTKSIDSDYRAGKTGNNHETVSPSHRAAQVRDGGDTGNNHETVS